MAASTGKKGSKISFSDSFAKSVNETFDKKDEPLVQELKNEPEPQPNVQDEPKEEPATPVEVKEAPVVSSPADSPAPVQASRTLSDVFSKRKKETYSVHKALLVKPSTMDKLQKILDERDLSFNFVVNTLLEMFIQDIEAVDVSFEEKK